MTRHTDAQSSDRVDATSLDDAELLEIARRGYTRAQAKLHDRHGYAARRLARRLAPDEQVDQIVADAFADIISDPDPNSRGSFHDLLFSTIRQHAADYVADSFATGPPEPA